MSYLLENNSDIIDDIIKRKEFNQYRLPQDENKSQLEESIIPRFYISKMIRDGNYLQFHSYQRFVANYINPNTPYSRLLMKWQTGSGKTIGSLSVAMNFIKYFQREEIYGSNNIGSVYVLGFASQIFYNEILRFPEFGIISREELKKLHKLKKMAYDGNKFDQERLQDFKTKIKKRFSNRKGNGFFRFIGYKKLVNMIFKLKKPLQLSKMDETSIAKAIADKEIELNIAVLDQFKNSLLICDEIHNVYNSLNKNNWGVALQYVLNYHTSVRALFMSATPINNKPSEIIDLLNLLLPNSIYSNNLDKSEYFNEDQTLKRNALDKIANLCKGRISYIRDVNPIYYPSKTFIGESIPGVAYLKFIRCPMSDFQYQAYKEAYTGHLKSDSQYVIDFALPDPESNKGMYQTQDIKNKLSYATQKWKDENKIYYQDNKIMGDILQLKNLPKISSKYTKMMETINQIISNQGGKIFIYHNVIHMSGVLFIQEILLQNHIISEFANSTDNTLCSICGNPRKAHSSDQVGGGYEEYSVFYNKNTGMYEVYYYKHMLFYYKLIDNVAVVLSSSMDDDYDIDEGMKFIEKDRDVVIKRTEKKANLDKYIANSNYKKLKYPARYQFYYRYKLTKAKKKSLINSIVKGLKKKHVRGGGHTFMPVRFIALHSELDKTSISNSLDKYNSPDNYDGARIMILIGGKLIKESYDIKAVREMMVMGRPDNIPTLIQILGRAVRKKSHMLLPEHQRNVNIRIFTSCLPTKKKGVYNLSHEEDKYKLKIGHYKTIQSIEKIIHANAIDSYTNQDILWRDGVIDNELGSLYFKPNLSSNINRTFKLSELNLETFNAFNSNAEVNELTTIIKRLFIEKSPVWIYEDLLYAVKNSHKWIQIEFNTKLICEDLFIIALSRLVWSNNKEYVEPIIQSKQIDDVNTVISHIFNSDDKIIVMPGNQKSVITQVGDYYMLFPIDQVSDNPIKNIEAPYRIIKEQKPMQINIRNFLEMGNSFINYEDKRARFFVKWNSVEINELEMAVCDFGTDFHISFLEECISYVFNVWTNQKIKKSSMHSFYFKMLNYYDLRRLIIWGHTLKENVFIKYKKYIKQVKINIKKTEVVSDVQQKSEQSSSGLINLLKSSINKSSLGWVSSGIKKQFNDNLNESLKLFDGNYRKKSSGLVRADLVPVGHYLNIIPRFYHPDTEWYDNPDYLSGTEKYKENKTIIGYDERSATGVHIRFKIRSPIQNIKQYKDTRMIEKGSVCSSKSKTYLRDISKQLGIKVPEKINVNKLCSQIRTKLIYLELKERMAETDIKWYYFIYEKRPETVIK